jgi:hypothetical protein
MNSEKTYFIENVGGEKVPVSKLDWVVKTKTAELEYYIADLYDGSVFMYTDDKKIISMMEQARKNTLAGIYKTIDHLPIVVLHKDRWIIYISLDNSVRANLYGFPLHSRLGNIIVLINKIIKNCKKIYEAECVFFFSESCRPSEKVSWLEMRLRLSKETGLIHIGEGVNNNDSSLMSFGISAFTTSITDIEGYFIEKICENGFGSIAFNLKLRSGIITAVHFPLDFKGNGKDNIDTLVNLQKMMIKYKIELSLGDFNSLPPFYKRMSEAILEEFDWIAPMVSFIGAFYDVLPEKSNIDCISIDDLLSEKLNTIDICDNNFMGTINIHGCTIDICDSDFMGTINIHGLILDLNVFRPQQYNWTMSKNISENL